MKNTFKKINEYAVVYGIGALIYSILEIVWRGFTHWTMALAGGLCLTCIYICNNCLPCTKLWMKCLRGTCIITSVEFLVGSVVNRMLNWKIWDYSDRFLNICGQVCLLYSALWFILCIPAVYICWFIKNKIFK